ncbi:hypothetical protein ASB58_08470 [Pseudomonas abyssi]|uniref:Uncharacterized protein n=1 Tax=Pseudomonas abyssi TaxID=170540 RepID=A0A395R4S3_9PSED|nr:hypothetical protein ASB58_08470 [Halopseudomonas gallaeciensis]
MNSGSIPAKNIQLRIDEESIIDVLGSDATEENRARWIRSVNANEIRILQNGDFTTCSFGTSQSNDNGFWKYGSEVPIRISYKGWFGYKYSDTQIIKIQDSDSFTGYMWGSNA